MFYKTVVLRHVLLEIYELNNYETNETNNYEIMKIIMNKFFLS